MCNTNEFTAQKDQLHRLSEETKATNDQSKQIHGQILYLCLQKV
jgi:hypothetical protein